MIIHNENWLLVENGNVDDFKLKLLETMNYNAEKFLTISKLSFEKSKHFHISTIFNK